MVASDLACRSFWYQRNTSSSDRDSEKKKEVKKETESEEDEGPGGHSNIVPTLASESPGRARGKGRWWRSHVAPPPAFCPIPGEGTLSLLH